ncbi:MAG: HlyD family secretion protein [Pelagimonas sp.]|jgi:multidrug resistance efflux pump|nr:HlyD family secretion protein [Pelagimonas sp.]
MARASQTQTDQSVAGVKVAAFLIILIAVAIVVWNALADRYAPSSSRSTFSAQVIQIAPRVSGRAVDVLVQDNQLVQPGDPLFQIDAEPYELAVKTARARLQETVQGINASTSQIEAAQAQVAQARVNVEKAEADADRMTRLVDRGVMAQVKGDDAQRALDAAKAALEAAESQAEAARRQLGDVDNSPQIDAAQIALENAEYDLASTTVTAPSFGAISNLHFAVGQFVSAGTPVVTFIDGEDIWISAEFRENQLGNIKPGAPVSVTFDAVPGQIFEARVGSIGWGISAGPRQANGLPVSAAPTEWFEPARRIPVRIDIDGLPLAQEYPVRLGGKVDVLVQTQGSGWVVSVASALQRLRSKLSYLY